VNPGSQRISPSSCDEKMEGELITKSMHSGDGMAGTRSIGVEVNSIIIKYGTITGFIYHKRILNALGTIQGYN